MFGGHRLRNRRHASCFWLFRATCVCFPHPTNGFLSNAPNAASRGGAPSPTCGRTCVPCGEVGGPLLGHAACCGWSARRRGCRRGVVAASWRAPTAAAAAAHAAQHAVLRLACRACCRCCRMQPLRGHAACHHRRCCCGLLLAAAAEHSCGHTACRRRVGVRRAACHIVLGGITLLRFGSALALE
jgi:hypothetical protein